jgi:hypothetical protein
LLWQQVLASAKVSCHVAVAWLVPAQSLSVPPVAQSLEHSLPFKLLAYHSSEPSYAVGLAVGLDVGLDVGLRVGADVGLRVGADVGLRVGARVVGAGVVVAVANSAIERTAVAKANLFE